MANFETYKNYKRLDETPAGTAGQALNDNFTRVADDIESLDSRIDTLENTTGLSGYSGYSGYSGATGATGATGASGTSGYSGYSGETGSTGATGATGASGLSGYSGYSGAAGATGTSGISGYSGYSGKGIYTVDAIATSNINLLSSTNSLSIDGVTISEGKTFLATNQTTPSENGIYVHNGDPEVSSSPELVSNLSIGDAIAARSGTTYSGSFWTKTTNTFTRVVGSAGATGTSGYSGYSGSAGAAGATGPSGTSGYSGYSGTAGAAGVSDEIIGIYIDGNGSVISTGSKGFRQIGRSCDVAAWYIYSDVSGSIEIDVKSCNYSGYPTTTSIIDTEIVLSSASKNNNTSPTWTSLNANDLIEFYVNSASTLTKVWVFLKLQY